MAAAGVNVKCLAVIRSGAKPISRPLGAWLGLERIAMISRRPSSRIFTPSWLKAHVVLGAAIVAAPACKADPGPGKLFEEDGTYELVSYDLEGSGYMDVRVQTGDEAFLLKLDSSQRVAQTAMCAENETDDPGTSQCRLASGTDSFWFCQCFAYAFQRDQMQWRQFQAGDTPPKVEFDAEGGGGPGPSDDTATGGGGGETSVDPAGDTIIMLAEIPGVQGEYEFAPLPIGVFGSDGLVSRFQFQQRAPSLFDQVFEDPDGRTPCQPCVP
jgi:hypothetical protein